MTLSKQLIILISALFLMIFSVNYVISVNNIRSYLQIESQVHAQDTATSLGLSLSPYIMNESDPILETMMKAIFDMGYYKEIKLVNVSNKPLVTLSNDKVFEEIPDWFIAMLPMATATAESEISSGWNLGGVIYVTINPGYAYLKLYQQAQSAFWYSLAAFVISIALLIFILRFILLPLKKINRLALTIADGHFETIERLPWTTEVRNVAISMNTMSSKLGAVMKNLNAKLETLGNKLQLDELTGLNKKSSFETDMKQLFLVHSEAYIFLIKIDSLAILVKEQGSAAVDRFLQDCADTLKQTADNFANADASAYHFYGAEFVLLVRNINLQKAEQLAKSLSAAFTALGGHYQKTDIAHIGVTPFSPLSSTTGILDAANEAYEQARLIGANGYHIRTGQDQAKDIAEWKALVFNVVDNDKYTVSLIGQTESFRDGLVLMEEAFIQAYDSSGGLVPLGTFISIAEKYEKIVDLDKGVTEKVIHQIAKENIRHTIAVNLSTRTVKNSDFRSWLTTRFKQDPAITGRLAFCVSAYAVARDFNAYKDFIEFAHALDAKIILKRFDNRSMPLDMAKALKPDYIRLSRDLGNGIGIDSNKQSFVETLKAVGELLDISVLAENIKSDQDYAAIKSIGIAGASR